MRTGRHRHSGLLISILILFMTASVGAEPLASTATWPPNPVVVPGRPAESRLYTTLTGDTRPLMPYTGGQLPAEQIEVVRRWIEAGAQEPDYTTKILPFFTSRCMPCHSSSSLGWDLALDSYTAMFETIRDHHATGTREELNRNQFQQIHH